MNDKNKLQFKRVPVGTSFSHASQPYRKIDERRVVRLLPSGRGQTHAPSRFPRSANCTF